VHAEHQTEWEISKIKHACRSNQNLHGTLLQNQENVHVVNSLIEDMRQQQEVR
jgi:HKD family nuclease